ncbi:MAG: DUF2284 domain-containing protein [Muribaculaceae bacterium]|nr:DUF2284 domain-containing protein [Muribaculaceae bacterium]
MSDLKSYCGILIERGADSAKIINPKDIAVAPWTIMKCMYGCPSYGHNRACPPYAPSCDTTRSILDCYSRAIIFRIRSMERATPAALACARSLANNGYYKAIAFGVGACTLCKQCQLNACPHPEKVAPSMEACGIDVIATARNAGYEVDIPPREGSPLSCFGLILVD